MRPRAYVLIPLSHIIGLLYIGAYTKVQFKSQFKVHPQLLYTTQIILCKIMPKILVTHSLKFEKQSLSKDYVLKRPKQITPTS